MKIDRISIVKNKQKNVKKCLKIMELRKNAGFSKKVLFYFQDIVYNEA